MISYFLEKLEQLNIFRVATLWVKKSSLSDQKLPWVTLNFLEFSWVFFFILKKKPQGLKFSK